MLEAKLYSTGIKEVLQRITQQRASMLQHSPEIFDNAQYLYSTPDYDGNSDIYRWNYFYTPIQIGDDILGVRIAIRDVAKEGESQIYHWDIKKDATLDGEGHENNNGSITFPVG